MKSKVRRKLFTTRALTAELAHICSLDYKIAAKTLRVICAYMVKRIKSDKSVLIPGFGKFKKYRKMVNTGVGMPHCTPGKKLAAHWSVTFRPAYPLKWATGVKHKWQGNTFPYYVNRKIRRLRDAGDTKKIPHFLGLLKKYLVSRPELEQWMREKHGLVYEDIKVVKIVKGKKVITWIPQKTKD